MVKWKVTRKRIKWLLRLTAFLYFPCWPFAVLEASLAFHLRSLYHAVVGFSFQTGIIFYLPYAFIGWLFGLDSAGLPHASVVNSGLGKGLY